MISVNETYRWANGFPKVRCVSGPINREPANLSYLVLNGRSNSRLSLSAAFQGPGGAGLTNFPQFYQNRILYCIL